ncbi:hypothetical protein [Flavobacterium sp. 1355]|uniref:hypothetical protein n=1 Tax=Flavobacterium sp. 1355 TaxID=2806571 RepID=UPI001AE4F11D|nr:hypothetical protein [Flavobacterium sp. 1355]MBP1222194.1 hypothetical protein [Flavobacterium sp. 1355]
MNIIELFEYSGIYSENLRGFTPEDVIKVKKQFDIEQSQNPGINRDVADNLILAINENPRELLFISNNRILYNFFSGKNYSRNRFSSDNSVSVSAEAIQLFIKKYLEKDLDSFFDKSLESNKFESIDDLLIVKEYLPQSLIDTLGLKLSNKLDEILEKMSSDSSLRDSFSSISFIQQKSFYDLVSHFRSEEMDQKIKAINNKVSSPLVDVRIKNQLLNPVMTAMANYKPVDPGFANLLTVNRNMVYAETESVSNSSSGGMSPWTYVVIGIIVLRLILLMARCGRM